jgi:FMN phosphatase YigB (HAD superfamily)
VGDSICADVEGARAVGITGVLIDRSGGKHSDFPVIHRLDELLELFE